MYTKFTEQWHFTITIIINFQIYLSIIGIFRKALKLLSLKIIIDMKMVTIIILTVILSTNTNNSSNHNNNYNTNSWFSREVSKN